MKNMKPEIVKMLESVCPTVFESYPDYWTKFPVLTYEEEQNQPYTLTTAGEAQTLYRYRVDIWTQNESTSALKSALIEKMADAGWHRTNSVDLNDGKGIKHTVIRFEAVYDSVTHRLFRP